MSLYNLAFGINDLAGFLMKNLDLDTSDVPRFRDCYYDSEKKMIVIYTRTGGGNRDFYENYEQRHKNYPEYSDTSGPWNEDLRSHPLFLDDMDDEYDSTYARFFFKVPENIESLLSQINSSDIKHEDRWEKLIETIKNYPKDE